MCAREMEKEERANQDSVKIGNRTILVKKKIDLSKNLKTSLKKTTEREHIGVSKRENAISKLTT